MRTTIFAATLLSSLLLSGCAVGLATPATRTTVYVPPPPPPPPPVMRPAPAPRPVRAVRPAPPPPRALSRYEAIRIGEAYCHDRGYVCRLDGANLAHRDETWKIRFDARRRGSSGKLHLEIDRYTGGLLRAEPKGKLRRG